MSNKSFSHFLQRSISLVLVVAFALGPNFSYAQSAFVATLPEPGSLINISPAFIPVLPKGLIVHPDNPLNFDLIVDSGHDGSDQELIRQQSERMAQYFLAAVTVPENQLWVNLSPYEQERVIENDLGRTVLGRDMLAQDYILKQLSASLIYPENGLGKKFWARVYARAREEFGTTSIPVDTFNKVWILPDMAEVYQNGNRVYITEARLKLSLDQDHRAEAGQRADAQDSFDSSARDLAKDMMRSVILPALEKEVNEGRQFAVMRQIYHAAILAKWYREQVQNTLMEAAYVGRNRVAGVTADEKNLKEEIYERYIAAFRKGAFDYVKEEADINSGEILPRKYFSGGEQLGQIMLTRTDNAMALNGKVGQILKIDFAMSKPDPAMESVKTFQYKPGVNVAVWTVDPNKYQPHILVSESLEGKLYPVDRRSNSLYWQENGSKDPLSKDEVRARVPLINDLKAEFLRHHPDLEIVATTGNENLFYNAPIVTVVGDRIYHAMGEEVSGRKYPMYVIWPNGDATIEEDVTFDLVDEAKHSVQVYIDKKPVTVAYATTIQFIKKGQDFIYPTAENGLAYFYDDVRHLFSLPLFGKEYHGVEGLMSDGIIFMADQFLADRDRIARYFANPDIRQEFSLTSTLIDADGIKREEGWKVPSDVLRKRLLGLGYSPDDFTIGQDEIFIRLKEGVYPFHIVGVTRDGMIKEIAVNGRSGFEGVTIREAAKIAEDEGLVKAGIIDQGTTVRLDVNDWPFGNTNVDKDMADGEHASSVIIYTRPKEANAKSLKWRELKFVLGKAFVDPNADWNKVLVGRQRFSFSADGYKPIRMDGVALTYLIGNSYRPEDVETQGRLQELAKSFSDLLPDVVRNKIAFVDPKSFHVTLVDLVAGDDSVLRPRIERIIKDFLAELPEEFKQPSVARVVGIDMFVPGIIKFNLEWNRDFITRLARIVEEKLRMDDDVRPVYDAKMKENPWLKPEAFTCHITLGYLMQPLTESEAGSLVGAMEQSSSLEGQFDFHLSTGQLIGFSDMNTFFPLSDVISLPEELTVGQRGLEEFVSINYQDLLRNIRAVATDVGGTLDNKNEDGSRAAQALTAVIDSGRPVFIVTMGGYKGVVDKIISKIDASKRKAITIFYGGGVLKGIFDDQGNFVEATATLDVQFRQDALITSEQYADIVKAADGLGWETTFKSSTGGDVYAQIGLAEQPDQESLAEMTAQLIERLPEDVRDAVVVSPDGVNKTAGMIMRKGAGKAKAFDEILRNFPREQVAYFGDEFYEGGVDSLVPERGVRAVSVDADLNKASPRAIRIDGQTGTDATFQWLHAIGKTPVDAAMISLAAASYDVGIEKDAAMKGGIDIQNISVAQKPGGAKIHFNDAAMRAVMAGGLTGLKPEIISITPVQSALSVMGM